MKNFLTILLNAIPVLVMIALIPVITNDYWLALTYIIIIIISLAFKHERSDFIIFAFGFVIMIICEYLFVSTGVETFVRNSLFGLMPIWLPLLWGYGFVAIKRAVEVLK
jgi:hypothetical protein